MIIKMVVIWADLRIARTFTFNVVEILSGGAILNNARTFAYFLVPEEIHRATHFEERACASIFIEVHGSGNQERISVVLTPVNTFFNALTFAI